MKKSVLIIYLCLFTSVLCVGQDAKLTSASAKLKGRSAVGSIPVPSMQYRVAGTVTVSIKVDQYGNVTEAFPGAEGTTVTNKELWNAARNAAMKAHFNMNTDAPALQTGTITFTFGGGTSVKPSIDYNLTSLKELVENKSYGEFTIKALFYEDYRDMIFLVEEDDYIIPVRLLKKDLGAEKRYRDLNINRGDTLIIKGKLSDLYVHAEEYKGLIDASIIDTRKGKRIEPDGKSETSSEKFTFVEERPSFNGGDANEFSKWVNSHLEYPKEADCAQGRVTVQFTVDIDGSVKDVSVLRGVEPSLDAEAVRVVSQSPKWKPGKSKGKPVPVRYTFPVIFQPR